MSKKFIKVLDNYMAKGIKLYLISNEVYVGFNDRMKDPTQILVKSRVFISFVYPNIGFTVAHTKVNSRSIPTWWVLCPRD